MLRQFFAEPLHFAHLPSVSLLVGLRRDGSPIPLEPAHHLTTVREKETHRLKRTIQEKPGHKPTGRLDVVREGRRGFDLIEHVSYEQGAQRKVDILPVGRRDEWVVGEARIEQVPKAVQAIVLLPVFDVDRSVQKEPVSKDKIRRQGPGIVEGDRLGEALQQGLPNLGIDELDVVIAGDDHHAVVKEKARK